MTRLYILDIDDFRPVIEVGANIAGVAARRIGDYVELATDGELVIDRRATGVRHAVWYSTVAGVADGRVAQFDKDALRVAPV
jgi:hypothetical protein